MFENERYVRIIDRLSRISESLERIANRLDSWDNGTTPGSWHHIKTNK